MSEKKKIHIKIVTHEKVVYEQDIDAVYTQGTQGYFGVLPDHVPFMSALDIGVTKLEKDDEIDYVTTMGGVFQFKDNEAVILTDIAEIGKDIDIERAMEAKKRAEERLRKSINEIDVQRAEMALAKAMARLKTAKRF